MVKLTLAKNIVSWNESVLLTQAEIVSTGKSIDDYSITIKMTDADAAITGINIPNHSYKDAGTITYEIRIESSYSEYAIAYDVTQVYKGALDTLLFSDAAKKIQMSQFTFDPSVYNEYLKVIAPGANTAAKKNITMVIL